jgi:shikimate kinase
MGSGKSTVGRILARRLGMSFVDLDDLIVSRAGRSIAAIFAAEGEPAFRRMETECLLEIAHKPPCVLGAGGGAPVAPANHDFFRTVARTFYLVMPFGHVAARTVNDGTRPLLTRPPGELEALYRQRLPVYQHLGRSVDTEGLTPDQVADRIVSMLAEDDSPG